MSGTEEEGWIYLQVLVYLLGLAVPQNIREVLQETNKLASPKQTMTMNSLHV